MVQVLLRHPTNALVLAAAVASSEQAYRLVSDAWGLAGFRITCSGCDIADLPLADLDHQLLEVEFELLGGKGGFGSLLRIAAAQKKHFNNFDSCRDSNGRRLRDIKNDIRMVEFLKKKKAQQKLIEEEQETVEKANIERRDNKANIAQAKVDEAYSAKLEEWKWRLGKVVKSSYLNKRKPKHLEESTDEKASQDSQPNKQLKTQASLAAHPAADCQTHQQPAAAGDAEGEAVPVEQQHTGDQPRVDGASTQPAQLKPATPPAHQPIDLQQLASIGDLEALSTERVTSELKRLGLKCGGTPRDRVQRLWDIKLDPSRLFSPKYLAKAAATATRH